MIANTNTRLRIAEWVESPKIQNIVIAVIVLNAVTLGMETVDSLPSWALTLLKVLDIAALSVFVIEIALKLYGRGLAFFKEGWNVFDFVIVAIALVPTSGPLSVLRSFRILRAFRLMAKIPQMRSVVQALITAIPGMLSIIGLISVIFYVSAVLTTNFYGDTFEEWFGSIGASMYTLFQVMTLESWSMGIVRPVMEQHPIAWAFFVPFILVTSFAVINLFIGVIVDSMQTQHAAEAKEIEDHMDVNDATLRTEISALRAEIRELKEVMAGRAS